MRRGWLFLARDDRGDALDGLQRGEDRFAGSGSLGEVEPIDGAGDRCPVGGGRDEHRCGAGIADEAEVETFGQALREVDGGFLRGDEPGRRDIGGLHGQGGVDGEDDGGAVARYALLLRRGGEGNGEQGQTDEHQHRGNVPLGVGAPGRDGIEQREVGELIGKPGGLCSGYFPYSVNGIFFHDDESPQIFFQESMEEDPKNVQKKVCQEAEVVV